MLSAIPFPTIDPVLIEIGPFAIRWYALAYIVGLILGWRYGIWLAKRPLALVTRTHLDDFLVWAIIAIILGGQLDFVLFYQIRLLSREAGGDIRGLAGRHVVPWRPLGRLAGASALRPSPQNPVPGTHRHRVGSGADWPVPRPALANFVNSELWGRPSDVPWAMVFPNGGPAPRHPSQLYEAGLEGAVLFVLLFFLARSQGIRVRRGLLSGVFLTGYAVSRIFVELFREPDREIGYLIGGTTMGQWLSLPMLAGGLYLILRACTKNARADLGNRPWGRVILP